MARVTAPALAASAVAVAMVAAGGWLGHALGRSDASDAAEAPRADTHTAARAAALRAQAPDGDASGERHARHDRDTAAEASTPTGPLGQGEQAVRRTLAEARVVRIKKGTGGRSLAFKLDFEDGSKGYFKPEQSFSGTNWYAEVAAYYLDRALGLGRVPPVVSRRMPWARLAAVAGDDRRVPEVKVGEDGRVRGALVAWIETPLVPAQTPPGWERWVRVEPWGPQRITPFQRPAELTAALNRRNAGEQAPHAYDDEPPEPDTAERPAELSDMLVFDFLTLNIDRWGGHNGNVLTLGAGGPLIFLDNAAGFAYGRHRTGLMDGRLRPCQRFRRRTIEALEALDVRALAKTMRADPLGPILDAHLLEGLELRRRAVLKHVAALRARHGDAAVLPW